MTLAGFFLGRIEFVQKNLEPIIVGIIVLSMIPLFRTFLKERKRKRELEKDIAAAEKEKEQSELKEFH
ncbi:hypothetical protein [Anseongella ginsenosidimutans]|nr:hypothetical protein [Anseongella ginsenosidimutans]